MRLLGIDFESTGLDTAKDRIIEMGLVLWDTDSKKPIFVTGFFLNDSYLPMSQEVIAIHGITNEMLTEFGEPPGIIFEGLQNICSDMKVDYLVAHNAENFDKPLLLAELARYPGHFEAIKKVPWIDTRTDIPFLTEPASRKLNHLAADHGFVNPFQHRAVFDVLTMLQILSHYDINAVLEHQKIPFVTVQALVGYEDRQLAKDARFSWENIGDKKYPKLWVKRIKKNLFDKEKETYKFQIKEIE